MTRNSAPPTDTHPIATGPVHISVAVALVLATTFTEEQLRVLADTMRSTTVRQINRRGLSPVDVEELAEMVATGGRPTVGWWRRHRQVAA